MFFCDKCVGKDGACCDFCKYYNFNGDEKGVYIEKGYCNKKQEYADPEDVCDEFHCENA